MAVIEVNGLTYTYPGSSSPALKDVSFQVEPGQLLAVIGANEAGKSSLCLALAGLIPALFHGQMQGAVTVCSMDTQKHTPGQFAGRVGLVLQNPTNQLSGMRYTVYEEVAFGLENLGTPRTEMPLRIEHALEQVGLTDLRARSPYTLSGGQQQRLALASVLVLEPEVLLLDEPTAMLDPRASQEVFEVVQKLVRAGTTVVVAEHHLEWIARYADRVIALSKGQVLLDGTPGEVLTSPLIDEAGIGRLRYTQAAELGQSRGLWPTKRVLPVVFEQAVAGSQQTGSIVPGQESKKMQIQIKDVHFSYPGGVKALEGVSLTIQAGEKVALVGQNGSGKTTLACHLNGLLRPQVGTVRIGDWQTSEHSPAQMARRVAYVFQNPDEQLFHQQVWGEVAFGPKNLGYSPEQVRIQVEQALDLLGLGKLAQLNPRDLGYSGRKRVALASAIAMQTPVVVFDEPTAGLDAREQEQLSQVISGLHEEGKTVLVISHDLDFLAENFERFVLIKNGRITLDTPAQDFWLSENLIGAPSGRYRTG
jgi:energy-coupling factor transport system ATP-binding protein